MTTLRMREGGRRAMVRRGASLGLVVAVLALAWAVALSRGVSNRAVFSAATWDRLVGFVSDLLGLGNDAAAYGDGAEWTDRAGLAVTTLGISALGAVAAGLGALATLPLTRVDANRRLFRRMASRGLQLIYAVTRSVPELVWALLLLFVMPPGVLAAAAALAIHNFGVIGRLGAALVRNTDPRPAAALRAAGAGDSALFVYGVMPQVLPSLLTFLLYRWEVMIRTTVIVGFVAGSGLGYRLRLDLSFFRYSDVGLTILFYAGVVLVVDGLSSMFRRWAR